MHSKKTLTYSIVTRNGLLYCYKRTVIAILEHFLLLEALNDSKILHLFLTDLVSVEFHRSQKMPCYLIFRN